MLKYKKRNFSHSPSDFLTNYADAFSDKLATEIDYIRNTLSRLGNHSWTTLKFQNDIIKLALCTSMHPGSIIEIGIFKGGITSQLAYICNLINKNLYSIDIDKDSINAAHSNLEKLNIPFSYVSLFKGTINEFVKKFPLESPPSFVIIDSLHTYKGVMNDLSVIISTFPNCGIIALHDYGLSYNPEFSKQQDSGIFVDVKSAVHTILSETVPVVPIGEYGKAINVVNITKTSSLDIFQNIFLEEYPEGICIFPHTFDPDTILRANYYYEKIERERAAVPQLDDNLLTFFDLEKDEWFDYALDVSTFSLNHALISIEIKNLGPERNFRLAILCPDEHEVFEKYFYLQQGNNKLTMNANELSVLRGTPQLSNAKTILVGGQTIGKIGIHVTIENY